MTRVEDHIRQEECIYKDERFDTNRRSDPRLLTRLENLLLNPISRKKIKYICGWNAE